MDGGKMQYISKEQDEIRIYRTRKAVSKLIVFGGVMAALAVYVLLSGLREQSVYVTVGGGIGLALSGFLLIRVVMRAMNLEPLVIINQDGIVDQSSMSGVGLIPWDQVVGMQITGVYTQEFLTISVRDMEGFLSTLQPAQERVARANLKAGFSGINITMGESVCSVQECRLLILEFMNAHHIPQPQGAAWE